MKNLGKIENKKDIATLGNINEIPYGTVFEIPKNSITPKGWLDWGESILARDYPHLIDNFGTTKIAFKEISVSMTSNTSSTDLYIDTTDMTANNWGCDTMFEDLYKVFDKNTNTGYLAGDGVSTEFEANGYNRRAFWKLKGKFIDDLYTISPKSHAIGIRTIFTQNNIHDYNNNALWVIGEIYGGSYTTYQNRNMIKPGEVHEGDIINYGLLDSVTQQEEQFLGLRSFASGAKFLNIKEIFLKLPVITTEDYIDIPVSWKEPNMMINIFQTEQMKLIMYVGNSIK